MKAVKFATQIDEKVLKELKKYAQESDKSISRIITEAVDEHLKRVRVRSSFLEAMGEVVEENKETLKRLAK